jgi:uncharacterized secreted protein with C-terminal beta-propeller domain
MGFKWKSKWWIFVLVTGLAITLIALTGCVQEEKPPELNNKSKAKPELKAFTNFSSEEELREYLSKSQSVGYSFGIWGELVITADVAKGGVPEAVPAPRPATTPAPIPAPTPTPAPTPGRYSTTNVQVAGIDEPDIVKTDGRNIYFSRFWMGWVHPVKFVPEMGGNTKIILAFPPEELEKKFEIDESGQLLLDNSTLIILDYDRIVAYNVSGKPEKVWNADLNSRLVAARLYDSKLYLITRSWIDYYEPIPVKPLVINGKEVIIDYTRIYHPIEPVYADVTYNVLILDPETGRVENSASFIGSAGQSIVYMSTSAIYITYFQTPDQADLMYKFLKENRDLVSNEVIQRIEKLRQYDISNRAKYVEIQEILRQYSSSLDRDERKKFENEFWNRLMKYREEHKRDLEKTRIVKMSLDLKPLAAGEIPGRLLNQFSLDEYQGYLRVATTIGDTNDLYVLDADLKVVGSIKDFGQDERIYAVRFIGDRGYIVTFRQTDPFFVIDLSDPTKPEIKGELKIPGYSSYLHPISEHIILGVGKEGSEVKVSLFDVSSPEKPEEIDRYILKEHWSDILRTHHAFLLDNKHKIFFLPGASGGYIFSYSEKLELVKAVDMPAIRAIYIDDYLYIIGDKIAVFDEKTWEKVNELDL